MVIGNRVLLCNCVEAGIGDAGCRNAVREGLRTRGIPFAELPDLCRLAATRPGLLREMADEGILTIIACHPRAVRWMLESGSRGRAPSSAGPHPNLHLLDLRAMTADAILEAVCEASPVEVPPTDQDDDWRPWFPVIDYDRCSNCGQCLSFCLFGVYSRTADGHVDVTNPRACKTNCPACARICPQVAIMFPKLGEQESPLNGAAITDEENLKARARINAGELLGDDLYAALAQRRQMARKRLLKTQQERQAEAERAACAGSRPEQANGKDNA
jgi:Pyruvate/2-oxoacid:ferredoxin oxidoreductase delta subunit